MLSLDIIYFDSYSPNYHFSPVIHYLETSTSVTVNSSLPLLASVTLLLFCHLWVNLKPSLLSCSLSSHAPPPMDSRKSNQYVNPVREERRCWRRLWNALHGGRPFCKGETCLRDEDKGDCLVLRELDQKFYYWSVLGGARRKLRVSRFPRGEKNGIPGRNLFSILK